MPGRDIRPHFRDDVQWHQFTILDVVFDLDRLEYMGVLFQVDLDLAKYQIQYWVSEV